MLRNTRGFTLVELLVVMIILAVLAAVIVPRVVNRAEQSRRAKAIADITNLETALRMYTADNGAPPSSEQGLDALRTEPATPPLPKHWNGPYLEKALSTDPWGNDYIYICPGEVNVDSFDLISIGADGEEGGDDDIANYDEEAAAEQ